MPEHALDPILKQDVLQVLGGLADGDPDGARARFAQAATGGYPERDTARAAADEHAGMDHSAVTSTAGGA